MGQAEIIAETLGQVGAVTWSCQGYGSVQGVHFTLNGRTSDANTFFACLMPASRSRLEDALASMDDRLQLDVSFANGDSALMVARKVGDQISGVILPIENAEGADTDALTQLYSRTAFLNGIQVALANGQDVAVATFDLDRMANLNETLGPDQGDRLLATLGGRLLSAYGHDLSPARVGEDEFAVILPSADKDLALDVKDCLEAPLTLAGVEVFPTFAMGIGTRARPDEVVTALEILRRAERELKISRAKDRHAKSHAIVRRNQDGFSQLVSEADLRRALENDEIVPFYQPIVSIEDGQLKGFEALMRWHHPKRGLLSPDDFLAMALELNLLNDFGRAILMRSAHQLSKWQDQFDGLDIILSVNVSGRELDREGLIEDISAVVKTGNLHPGALRVEVTEQQILPDIEAAIRNVNAIKTAGASVALDDFGAGFSSLSYLARLPVDALKIDRYFVHTMATSMGSSHIVRSVIDLARSFDLEVVAEGVERIETAEMLKNFGCPYAQGFRYAPPLPRGVAEDYIRQFTKKRVTSGAAGA